MTRRIKIKNRSFEYVLRRRRGARCVRLAIYPDGVFVVSAPKWYPIYVINRFLEEKAGWIYDKLKNVDFGELAAKEKTESDRYKVNKETARQLIRQRVDYFNRYYRFAVNRIAIKNQRRCWGSASAKGNLNFNWKVALLPPELRDYVIVHELCHLRELNHGRKFWDLVKITTPDHKAARTKLRNLKIL